MLIVGVAGPSGGHFFTLILTVPEQTQFATDM